MTADFNRNRIYQTAIQIAAMKDKRRFFEIGAGADAVMTRMILDVPQPTVVQSIEGNAMAFEYALQRLQKAGHQPHRWSLSHRLSTEMPILNAPVDALVQELIGFIASREGIVYIMRDVQNRLLKNQPDPPLMIPGATATFFKPTLITTDDLQYHFMNRRSLFTTSDSILIGMLPLDRVNRHLQSGCLEFIDFTKDLNTQVQQSHTDAFVFQSETRINSLSLWIWAGFDVNSGHNATTAFPYGCQSLTESEQKTWQTKLSFSSATGIDGTCTASNWQNYVMLFPGLEPWTMQPGEIMTVKSDSDMRDLNPFYRFEIRSSSLDKKPIHFQFGSCEFYYKQVIPARRASVHWRV